MKRMVQFTIWLIAVAVLPALGWASIRRQSDVGRQLCFVTDPQGVTIGSAAPGAGGPGGLNEVSVPNPQTQIQLQGVYGVNPPY